MEKKRDKTSNHLANETTFLAWVRTGLGLIAFGIVLERFSIFIKQIPGMVTGTTVTHPLVILSLLVVGAIVVLLAYINYKLNQKAIERDSFIHSTALPLILTILVFLFAVFLIYTAL